MSATGSPSSNQYSATNSNPQPDEIDKRFQPFADKMRAEGLPDIAIRTFRYYYAKLLQGDTGYISGEDARPVGELTDAGKLDAYHDRGMNALDSLVMVKLNGGLGTSMGMTGPKSLIDVKNGLNFLEIVTHQVLELRNRSNARVPLVLMNSFNTREESLQALSRFPEIESDIPLDFVQHKEPKVWKENFSPAEWPQDPDKEWCPPGHGDIYPALISSGMLEHLLDAGYEYAFVSNIDNLGATIDPDILGFFAAEGIPFLMEVTRRTPADRKGGHLAQNKQGELLLREIAQCPPDEVDDFQNIDKYQYFNTNNLWIHLPTLAQVLDANDGLLKLPMIRNEKPVDPTQPDSPKVYQIETAMGLAISSFEGAQAINIPRSRFQPVKRCNDLLALWSDAYRLTDDYHITLAPEREEDPLVELDDRYYKLFDDMTERFPNGAPSLRKCRVFEVVGNVFFGEDVVVKGEVTVDHGQDEALYIEDGTVLEG